MLDLLSLTTPPKELYNKPDNLFVAQFIGSPKMNILPCEISHGKIQIADGGLLTDPDKGSVTQLGIRPENITVVEAGKGQIDGDIDLVEYLGADTFLIVSCGELGRITVRITGVNELETAMRIGLSFSAEKMHYFDSEGYAL